LEGQALVKALVLRAAGTNCDKETAFAFEAAGANTSLRHINALKEEPKKLLEYQIICIPGGFTYGDDIAAGAVLALQIRLFLQDMLLRFLDGGGIILGICNGFQVLAKCGLLPRFNGSTQQCVTLATNDSARFEDRWAHLVCTTSRSVLLQKGERLFLPVAHAEGKFLTDSATLERLFKEQLVALRYTDARGRATQRYPDNPNGSYGAVAALCDTTGRVLGMMPHPERHMFTHHHPFWQRLGCRNGEGDGMRIFRRAVAFFKG